MGKAAILCAVVVVVSMSACSVLSGWSDLQGGRREVDGGKPGGGDAAQPVDGSTSGDARVDGSGSLDGVQCGAARCPTGQGCCIDFNGAKQCTTAEMCTTNNGELFSCTSAGSCSAAAPVCCFAFGEGASCIAACGTTQSEICAPTEANPCSGGKACTKPLQGLAVLSCK